MTQITSLTMMEKLGEMPYTVSSIISNFHNLKLGVIMCTACIYCYQDVHWFKAFLGFLPMNTKKIFPFHSRPKIIYMHAEIINVK